MEQGAGSATGWGEKDALRAMFRARKEVFIDLLKWDLPVLLGEYEIDQFDDAEAEYLILLQDGVTHRASARLAPRRRGAVIELGRYVSRRT